VKPTDIVKWAFTAVLVIGALVMVSRSFWTRERHGELAFFYDPSAERLFTAPSTSVPPIPGVDSDEEDAVRAVVISPTGETSDRSSWQISYLEKYSPELKRQMEAAQAGGGPPALGRGAAQAHRFVRRPGDTDWYPLSSPEAEAILSAWLTAGPDGQPATICTP
jgi:hypothetical protein